MAQDQNILARLMAVVESRRAEMPAHSYTTRLFDGGLVRIGAKVLEEADELVEAAGEELRIGREHVVKEAADLFYHVLVLLAQCDLTLADVEAELSRRFGISGLDEKASRGT